MRHAVRRRHGNAQGLHDGAGHAVEQIDYPAEGVEEPTERDGHEQGDAFRARQAYRFGNEFAHHNVQDAQQGKRTGQGDAMSQENRVRSRLA